MGLIAFIMLVASGYAEVIIKTGAVEELVNSIYSLIGKAIGVLLMLLVGLLITMGIGTSFKTMPVVAAIYSSMYETWSISSRIYNYTCSSSSSWRCWFTSSTQHLDQHLD